MDRLKTLKRQMQSSQLCAESMVAVHNTHGDMAQLVACYFYYIRQCVKQGFPSLDYIRTHLGAEAAQYGGYIDQHGEIQPVGRDMAFFGNCDCQFTATGYNIHRVWLQHNSRLVVVATDNSHLHIDCFGNSELVVRVASPKARVWVNSYGNSRCTIEGYTQRATTTIHQQETY